MFDYYCPVWANVSISGISKVKNSQKKAAISILGPFHKILRYLKAVKTYILLNGHTLQYMANLNALSHNKSYNLRSSVYS